MFYVSSNLYIWPCKIKYNCNPFVIQVCVVHGKGKTNLKDSIFCGTWQYTALLFNSPIPRFGAYYDLLQSFVYVENVRQKALNNSLSKIYTNLILVFFWSYTPSRIHNLNMTPT